MYINGLSARRENGQKKYYSRSLFKEVDGTQFVYYERLKDDYPEFYSHVKSRYKWLTAPDTTALGKVVDFLQKEATAQLMNERAALEYAFGVSFDYDLSSVHDKNFYKELIETLNICLEGQKVYERNRDRLLYKGKTGTSHGMGDIDISSIMSEYLDRVLGENQTLEMIISEIERQNASNPSADMIDIIQNSIAKVLPDILQEALIRAYESQAFTEAQNKYTRDASGKTSNEKTAGAYKELVDWMKTVKNAAGRNPLVDSVYQELGIEKSIGDLTNIISQALQNSTDIRKIIENPLKGKKLGAKIITNQKEGFLAEIVETALGNIANSMKDVVFLGTGGEKQLRAQADWMIYFGPYAQALKKEIGVVNKQMTRGIEGTGDALEKMFHKTKAASPNFIAYVNSKNYAISESYFKKNGFGAGTPQSLDKLLDWLPNRKNAEQLISAMMQMSPGAIGDKKDLQQVTAYLSEAIAHFLFNDFATMDLLEGEDARSFHLFWLSGLYVPLSWFLFAIAEALYDALSSGGIVSQSGTSGLYKFSLSTPELLYVDYDFRQDTPEERAAKWREQGQFQRRNTIISLRFLSNFQRLMSNIL